MKKLTTICIHLSLLVIILSTSISARAQQCDFQDLIGEWIYRGGGPLKGHIIDVRPNGDVWRSDGPLTRVACGVIEAGGNFAFEGPDNQGVNYQCVYYVSFAADEVQSIWTVKKRVGNFACPEGEYIRRKKKVDKPRCEVALPSRPAQPLSAAEECALKAKDTFKECEICPELVLIAADSFTMGSPKNEERRSDDEGPQHKVTIGKPFAVGKFEVTKDQFAAFLQDSGHDAGSTCYVFDSNKWDEKQGLSWRNPGFEQTGSHPATCINWHDAKAYAAWLSRKTGKTYRLLTEAEWEYAARASNPARYHFGDRAADLCLYANGADQSVKKANPTWTVLSLCDDGYVYTAPVGSFAANAFGLSDMHGNVWEWVEDCWNDSYKTAPADGSPWSSGKCDLRVLRGGSWSNNPPDLRAAYRNRNDADVRANNYGFRVARPF
jgi:formylglycine-generating enzyme required for sulfatase activity